MLKAFAFLFLFCTCVACIPAGVPEYFAEVGPPPEEGRSRLARSPDSRSRVLLVISDTAHLGLSPLEENPRQTLGHQYLLGVIPFTNLFLEHSKESFILEVAFETLQHHDFEVLTSRQSSAALAAEQFRPALIVQAKLHELDLNAFDGLMLRIMRLSGKVEIILYDYAAHAQSGKLQLKPVRSVKKEISKKSYRETAHVPMLSYFLKSAVGESFEEAFRAILAGRPRPSRVSPRSKTEQTLVSVLAPRSRVKLSPEAAQAIAESYGFHSTSPYSERSLMRVIQRGLEAGLHDLDLDTVTHSEPSQTPARLLKSGSATWFLHTIVKSLSLELEPTEGLDSLLLETRFYVKRPGPHFQEVSLFGATCQIDLNEIDAGDGDWIVTLERAAYLLAQDLFTPNQEKGGSVRCNLDS